MTIYGVDFGTGSALAIHGPNGPVSKRSLKLPRVEGGRTRAMEFPLLLHALFEGSDERPAGDVVVEAPTLGSSGGEVALVQGILAKFPERKLFTISARACKNFRKDHDAALDQAGDVTTPRLGWDKTERYAKDGKPPPVLKVLKQQKDVHAIEALIIYRIATETPYRLHHWTKPRTGPQRIHTSVRPMDKHEYRDERSQELLALLPPFDDLPQELRDTLGVWNSGRKDKRLVYSATMVIPFAMASQEPFLDAGPVEERRKRFEKLAGLYDFGYPSFYRKTTDVWLEVISKLQTGKLRRDEMTRAERKAALKTTQRQIRHFFHLMMQHQGR